jgi:hypothetical protein
VRRIGVHTQDQRDLRRDSTGELLLGSRRIITGRNTAKNRGAVEGVGAPIGWSRAGHVEDLSRKRAETDRERLGSHGSWIIGSPAPITYSV